MRARLVLLLVPLALGCPKSTTPPRTPAGDPPKPDTPVDDGVWRPDWAVTFGGEHFDSVDAMTIDAEGNIYCTGRFFGTADFDPGEEAAWLASPHPDLPVAYVVKFDPSGAYQWAQTYGGDNNALGEAITIDASGNCWIAGAFTGSGDFDPTPAQDWRKADELDGFLVQIDPQGNRIRAITFTGNNLEEAMSLYARPDGGVTFTGLSSKRLTFSDGVKEQTLETEAYASAFVATVPVDGLPTSLASWPHVLDRGRNLLQILPDGTTLVAGLFAGQVDFDPSEAEHLATATNRVAAFLLALEPDFGFRAINTWGDAVHHDLYQFQQSSDGGLFLTGQYIQTADLNPFDEVTQLTAPEGLEGYVLRLNSSTEFGWARGLATTPTGLALLPDGRIAVSGDFANGSDLDPGAEVATFNTPDEAYDAFLVLLDTTGDGETVQTFGGPHFQMLSALGLKPDGALIAAGRYQYDFALETKGGPLKWRAKGEGDADSFLASFAVPAKK